jgi:hypothetical protein
MICEAQNCEAQKLKKQIRKITKSIFVEVNIRDIEDLIK